MALGDTIEVDSGTYTPESLKLRRRMAEALLQQGNSMSPISSHWQGLARLAQAALGQYQIGELERKEKDQQKASNDALLGLLGPVSGGGGSATPSMFAPAQEAPAQPVSVQNEDGTTSTFIGEVGSSSKPQGMDLWKTAIAGIETPGSKDPYRELGPVVQSGDRAYGKYQVMGTNIGPWTKEVLGTEMSPKEFLASPDAQERVFEGKFGSYVQKYGTPEAAASVWFTGRPSAPNARARDAQGRPLGITGAEYVQKFSGGADSAAADPDQPRMVPTSTIPGIPQGGGQTRMAQAGMVQTDAPQLPPQVTPEIRARIGALLSNPATRQLGMAMMQQYLVPPKPMTPMEQAELANKRANLQKTQADIVKTQAETDKAKAEMPKTPEDTAKQFAGGIEQLRRFPVEFGTEAFERAMGPWSASSAQDNDPQGGFWGTGASVNSLGQMVARGVGEAKAALYGGAAPTEVRDRVETAMKNLAAVMKPLIRKPGEGAWSDKDQANLEAQIGQLSRVRDAGEYRRRLNDIEENMNKIFQVPVRTSETVVRSDNAPKSAEEDVTAFESASAAVPTDAQIMEWLDKNVMEKLRSKGGKPLSPEEKQEMMIRAMQAGGY